MTIRATKRRRRGVKCGAEAGAAAAHIDLNRCA
jgi:hypothetical protein